MKSLLKVLVLVSLVSFTMVFTVAATEFASLKPGEKVTMRFAHAGSSDAEKQFMVNFKKMYEAKNPNVTVEFIVMPGGEALQKLTIMGAAGDTPDVLGVLDVGDLAAMTLLEPLDA